MDNFFLFFPPDHLNNESSVLINKTNSNFDFSLVSEEDLRNQPSVHKQYRSDAEFLEETEEQKYFLARMREFLPRKNGYEPFGLENGPTQIATSEKILFPNVESFENIHKNKYDQSSEHLETQDSFLNLTQGNSHLLNNTLPLTIESDPYVENPLTISNFSSVVNRGEEKEAKYVERKDQILISIPEGELHNKSRAEALVEILERQRLKHFTEEEQKTKQIQALEELLHIPLINNTFLSEIEGNQSFRHEENHMSQNLSSFEEFERIENEHFQFESKEVENLQFESAEDQYFQFESIEEGNVQFESAEDEHFGFEIDNQKGVGDIKNFDINQYNPSSFRIPNVNNSETTALDGNKGSQSIQRHQINNKTATFIFVLLSSFAHSTNFHSEGNVSRVTVDGQHPLPPFTQLPLQSQNEVLVQRNSSRGSTLDLSKIKAPLFDDTPSLEQDGCLGASPFCPNADQGFCLYDSNYPSSYIESLLENDSILSSKYIEEGDLNVFDTSPALTIEREESFNYSYFHPSSYDNSHWFGPEGYICPSRIAYIQPVRARNKRGEWKLIINAMNLYTQTLRTEICLYPGTPCRLVAPCYRSRCIQKYSYTRLLAFDPHQPHKGLHIDLFRLPSACSCYTPSFRMAEYTNGIDLSTVLKIP